MKSPIRDFVLDSFYKSKNTFDITRTTYENIAKNIDIFTYSFPCQDLSIQGKRRGMSKESNSRSSLLWQIERILTELKDNFKQSEMPKYLLMENVASVINKNNIDQFNLWKESLNNLGYISQHYILNAKDFGSCQNRSRAFLISIRKDWKEKVNFKFPTFTTNQYQPMIIKDILQKDYDPNLIMEDILTNRHISEFRRTKSNIVRAIISNYTKFNSENYVYCLDGIGPTLTATGANSRIKIMLPNGQIRMLSNLENFLYMGFTKRDYERVNKPNLISNQKMTFLCGNSISVQVLEAIFKTFKF